MLIVQVQSMLVFKRV